MNDQQFYPKKSLGQHWLHDEVSLQAVADAIDIGKGDTVFEIGPGLGTLTQVLAARADRVIAIEADHDLAAHLQTELQEQSHIEIVQGDVRDFDLTTLPKDYKVAANIPYYLTSYIMRQLASTTNRPKQAALLVQKEVAERVCAEPGSMSILALSIQLYADPSIYLEVDRSLFTPPPRVDSAILQLDFLREPRISVDEKDFFRIVKAGFSAKRKMLKNSLSGGLRITMDESEELLVAAQVDPGERAQALTLDQWADIVRTYRESSKQ